MNSLGAGVAGSLAFPDSIFPDDRYMTRNVYVIRHVAFEDLGWWDEELRAFGQLRYLQAGVDDLSVCIKEEPELLIVLGGPISAYEVEQYPFISDELEVIRHRLELKRPLLGICLGAQLIAAAAGARVYSSGTKEIGWGPTKLTSAGESSCLRHLAAVNHTVLHWHGDTFDLPSNATLLASTALTKNQAFAIGRNTLALQFHIEVDPRKIDTWLIGHTCELGSAGIKPTELRRSVRNLPTTLQTYSKLVLTDWLAGIQ
jgi:GMP synthase (glutamine-hydrolysing)